MESGERGFVILIKKNKVLEASVIHLLFLYKTIYCLIKLD